MILAVETSCDDTCAALVTQQGEIRANVISSQGIHDRFGGVVPEVAARHHLELADLAIADALDRAGWTILYCGASTPTRDIAAIARDRGARLVALSVARRALLPEMRRTVTAIRAVTPATQILVGGQGCTRPDDCPDADELVIGADYRPAVRRLRRQIPA